MKKILLLAAAALMVTTATAQTKRSEMKSTPVKQQTELFKPQSLMKEMPVTTPDSFHKKAPKKAGQPKVYYRRPAGGFTGNIVVEDGAYAGVYYAPYLFLKPYADYTFKGYSENMPDDVFYEWDYQKYEAVEDPTSPVGYTYARVWNTVPGIDLTMQWGYETDSVPVINAISEGGSGFWYWFMHGYKMSGSSTAPVADEMYSSYIAAIPNIYDVWGEDILKSSKNFCFGGVNGDQRYPFITYTGLDPTDDQIESQMSDPDGGFDTPESCVGFWFGKNKGTSTRENEAGEMVTYTRRIDGIGQAFEKPEHPYLLNSVNVLTSYLDVAEDQQVEMTCKIYKLDQMAEYGDAILPEEPGELIAQGIATLTKETNEETGGLITFSLYDTDPMTGLPIEVTPTIDYPIMVVIDGYNDPEMAALTDFSAMCSTDDETDEGFGELAYIKYGRNDDDGNFDGTYLWVGLYDMWELKTGLSIFLSTDLPFLTFNMTNEDAKYLFPNEGGLMEKPFGDSYVTRSIEFYSSLPSVDDAWFLTCKGEDVPEWLTITLTDDMELDEETGEEEFTGLVNAEVVAEPLPEGLPYREAVVRFEFPGAYKEYKFMQGEKPDRIPGDVNGDGSVNIADINAVIDLILSDSYTDAGDVNGDGSVNIGDINALIAIILK